MYKSRTSSEHTRRQLVECNLHRTLRSSFIPFVEHLQTTCRVTLVKMVSANPATILNLKNICRLCGNKMELMWIFDTKFNFPQPMKSIVSAVTTIEVSLSLYISRVRGQFYNFRHVQILI